MATTGVLPFVRTVDFSRNDFSVRQFAVYKIVQKIFKIFLTSHRMTFHKT